MTRYQLDAFDHQILEVLAGRRAAQQPQDRAGAGRHRRHDPRPAEAAAGRELSALHGDHGAVLSRQSAAGVHRRHGGAGAGARKWRRRLRRWTGIRSVIITLGRFNIHVVGMYGTLEEVLNIANNAILALPGVRHVETSISVKQLKYDSRLAKITRPFVPVDDDEE